MNECKDLISLNEITSEVDESHIKIILSSQCIKAQIFLVERLRKESDRQKEVCKHLSSSNVKLDAEIKHAALELKSLMIAVNTMQSSNIELKKDLLLMKERAHETMKRCQSGNIKYEQLWLQCKKRYESIPYVQKWFEFTNKNQTLNERIKFLDQETITLKQEIKSKRALLLDFDKKKVVELSKFLVEERSKVIMDIKEKISQVNKLNKEINVITKDQNTLNRCTPMNININENSVSDITSMDTDWPILDDCLNKDECIIQMPKLQLGNYDLNIFTVNLEQKKKISMALVPSETLNKEAVSSTAEKDNVSSLFAKSYFNNDDLSDSTNKNSQKRLINIIEDVNLDKREAVNIISTINTNDMQIVESIGVNNPIKDQDTEDKSNEINIVINTNEQTKQDPVFEVIPPSQFLDEDKSPQGSLKKKVSFELPAIQEVADETIDDSVKMSERIDDEANVTVTSQLDISVVTDESFIKMKEIILKRHRLDSSPDFVYAKKNKDSQKNNNTEETSKFFTQSSKGDCVRSDLYGKDSQDCEISGVAEEVNDLQIQNKPVKPTEEQPAEVNSTAECSGVGTRSVAGFLFTHGPLGIPDSLDVSISTTGYEEGDMEFPHCIDSSLLLSPKADNVMASGSEAPQVMSQEIPNFLSGLRKGGFSFFGNPSTIDSSPQQEDGDGKGNNFNFNFGGDNKKSKGLFSMFQ